MSLIYCYQNRSITKDLTIKSGAGATIVPGENDLVRIRVGRSATIDTAPVLAVTSNAATAAGSTLTTNSPGSGLNRLVLKAADLGFSPGTYTAAIDLWDNADSAWKNVSRQIFQLEPT